jgi:S1-C subfamily serine protease
MPMTPAEPIDAHVDRHGHRGLLRRSGEWIAERRGGLAIGVTLAVILCVTACIAALPGSGVPRNTRADTGHVLSPERQSGPTVSVPPATTLPPPTVTTTTTPPTTSTSPPPAPATAKPPVVAAVPVPSTQPTDLSSNAGEQIESTDPGAPSDSSDIAQGVDPTLTDIVVQLPGGSMQSGTGIVLTDSGEILTNDHVINGAVGISATDVGSGETYTAQVIGTDQSEDLAVLQLDGANGLQTAALGDSDSVFPGEGVVAVGNAHGVGGMPSYAGGSVIALQQHIVEDDDADGWNVALGGVIETNAQILPGDSGGPLVDGNGDVVGVDTAILDSAPGGFAIPIDEALEVADEIVDQAG